MIFLSDSSRSRGDIAVAGVRSKLDARLADSDLPPEVIAYEKFLETSGGVRGGWRQEDHETFLKVARQVGLVEGVAATAWSGEVKEPGEPRINRYVKKHFILFFFFFFFSKLQNEIY